MAQEGSEASVASSSSEAANNNAWEFNINPMLTSWHPMNHWSKHNHNSSSSCEEDISISNTNTTFTNVSNHSGLSINSSSTSHDQQVEHQLLSQVLLNIGGSGDHLHSHCEEGENKFLQMLTSKNQSAQSMFIPAYDYLNKLDSNWEFANSSSLMSNSKESNNSYSRCVIEPERLTNNLSALVNNWSIAPPSQQLDQQNNIASCNASISPLFQEQQYSISNNRYIKHEVPNITSSQFGADQLLWQRSKSYEQLYKNHKKVENRPQYHDTDAQTYFSQALPKSFGLGLNQSGLTNSSTVELDKFYGGMTHELHWPTTKTLTDNLPMIGYLKKPVLDLGSTKLKVSDTSSSMRQRYGHSTTNNIHKTRTNAKTSNGAAEGKKKRSEESSEVLLKKSKSDSSTTTAIKPPKVKLGDKITILQQLVSPFGKTDTASVLYETINCIRVLQEQVQLLSDPFMKSSASKDHSAQHEFKMRKEKEDQKLDLRSKGLCLIPISCIPAAHTENNIGPDYWMPTYRSYLYR